MLTFWLWMTNISGVIEGGLFEPLFTWIDVLFVTPAMIVFIIGGPIGDFIFELIELRKLKTPEEKENEG